MSIAAGMEGLSDADVHRTWFIDDDTGFLLLPTANFMGSIHLAAAGPEENEGFRNATPIPFAHEHAPGHPCEVTSKLQLRKVRTTDVPMVKINATPYVQVPTYLSGWREEMWKRFPTHRRRRAGEERSNVPTVCLCGPCLTRLRMRLIIFLHLSHLSMARPSSANVNLPWPN